MGLVKTKRLEEVRLHLSWEFWNSFLVMTKSHLVHSTKVSKPNL